MSTSAPTVVAITSLSSEGKAVRALIQSVLEENGIETIDLENVPEGGAIWAKSVQDAVTRADFVVADLTGMNPNVLYEIGYAHAWGKHVIFLVRSDTRHVPTDLSGHQFLIYNDETDLKNKLLQILETMYICGRS